MGQPLSFSLQGVRDYQQDEVDAHEYSSGIVVLAVADGHRTDGKRCAANAVAIAESALRNCVGTDSEAELPKGFFENLAELLKTFLKSRNGGTTLSLALLNRGRKRIDVAWAGDSEIRVLNGSGSWRRLTAPHQYALNSSERERIAKVGVDAIAKQWFSDSGPTRGFGNADLPPFFLSEFETATCALSDDDRYIIAATDGFWEAVDADELASVLRDTADCGDAFARMRAYVSTKHLHDNTTCAIARLT